MGTAGNPAPLHSRSRCLWKKSTMLGCSKTPCSIAQRMQDAWWDAVMTPECSWFSRSDRSLFFSWLRQYFIKIGWSPHYTLTFYLHPHQATPFPTSQYFPPLKRKVSFHQMSNEAGKSLKNLTQGRIKEGFKSTGKQTEAFCYFPLLGNRIWATDMFIKHIYSGDN